MPYQVSHRGPPGPTGPSGPRGLLGHTGPTGPSSIVGSDGSQVSHITVGTLGVATSLVSPLAAISKLGVGTVPTQTLDVYGTTSHVGNVYVTSGNLGVGTTDPHYTLDVVGDVQVSRLVIGGDVTLSATSIGESVTVAAGLLSVQGNQTSAYGHTIGAKGILSGASNGASTPQGTFFKTVGWDEPSSEHLVTYKTLWFNFGNDNVCGQLRFFVSNKSVGVPKAGMVVCDFYKLYGEVPTIVTTSVSRSSDLVVLSVSVVENNVVVYTDDDCRICWNLFGAL